MTREEKQKKLADLNSKLDQYEEQYYYYPNQANAKLIDNIMKEIDELEAMEVEDD